jgi:Kef-type K+ transport system membrane component KefB
MSEAAQFHDLVVLLALAVIAPLIAQLARRISISAVVLEILLGILIGPQLLDLVSPGGVIDTFGTFGLALLFFLGGFEIDPARLRGQPMKLASTAWAGSLAIGLSAGAVLALYGVVVDSLIVGLALTTTALGALVPILRDRGDLRSDFGASVSANGAIGEFGPIVAIALLLAGDSPAVSSLLLLLFVALVVVALLLARLDRPAWFGKVLRSGLHTSSQLPVRMCLLLVALLVWVAAELGLDLLLGAFAAGVIVRFAVGEGDADRDVEVFSQKLEAIGFGVFIPIFFVKTGVSFDVDALFASWVTILKVPFFLSLLLVARGVPVYLAHRKVGTGHDRLALALYSATALPLIVAITTIGLDAGRMRPDNATALVAAGMLSVLAFPVIAGRLRATQRPAEESMYA